MDITDATTDDVKKFLGQHGMTIFKIVSYFLEGKFSAIKEEHLIMEGWGQNRSFSEIIKIINKEIEHYGAERLFLSERFLWERGEYVKGYIFDFPLGEITEEGELIMSDLYAKFSIEGNQVKLRMFDVP